MDEIRDLLVIVDPTAADQPAVEKAGILAAKLRANVELLACETKYSAEVRLANQHTRLPPDEAIRRLREWLESLAVPLRLKGIEVRTSAISGDPLHESLLKWVRNSPADIVIKDTHHHSLVRRTFLSNTDWHLIRDCPVALLLAKATRWHEPPVLGAAVDPVHDVDTQGLLDHRILECARKLAGAFEAPTHIVHAYYPALVAGPAAAGSTGLLAVTPELMAAEKTLKTQAIASLLASCKMSDLSTHVDMGVPSQYLPAIAEEYHIDILIMGVNARTHLQAVIGGTAERVLEHLPCDVLAVKPANLAAALPF